MKKLKKLSVLALLAVGFALVFGGCSNGSSSSAGGSDGGNGGGQTNNGGGSNGDENTTDGAKGKVIKGIGVGGDEGFTFADVEITHVYNGKLDDAVDENGILGVPAQYYGYTYITLPEAVNISSYTKMIISAKVSDNYEDKDEAVIFEFASGKIETYTDDDNHFLHKAGGVSGVTSWTDGSFLKLSNMKSTDFTSFTMSMDKFSNLKSNEAESSYDVKSAVDMTNVTEFAIHPRHGNGTLYIQSIKFE